MVLGGLQAFDLVSILLLLLPGWLGLKLYLEEVERTDRLNRIDTVVVSIGISISIILVSTVPYTVSIVLLNCCDSSLLPTTVEFSEPLRSPPVVTLGYLFLLTSSSYAGIKVGDRGWFIRFLPEAPNKVWRTRLEGIENSPGNDKIRVVTSDGDHIKGDIETWNVESRDIVLSDPERIDIGVGGDERTVRDRDGRVYFRDSEIARVHVEKPAWGDESSVDSGRSDTKPDDDIAALERTSSDEGEFAVSGSSGVRRVDVLQQIPEVDSPELLPECR